MCSMISTENKKYHIGYAQGAFDMFHVGHLNLIKNAKDRCDYLIVGINTDQLISSYKNKEAIIPLEERLQIVEAIKHVDQVIQADTLDKVEIWEQHHFDAVFIGSDWKGNQRWKDTEVELSEYGVDVVYLPYTKGTTSSLLREKLIEK